MDEQVCVDLDTYFVDNLELSLIEFSLDKWTERLRLVQRWSLSVPFLIEESCMLKIGSLTVRNDGFRVGYNRFYDEHVYVGDIYYKYIVSSMIIVGKDWFYEVLWIYQSLYFI